MSVRVFLAATIAVLATLAVGSGSSARALANTWTGTWDTEWGAMPLTQTGSQVEGTYPFRSGHLAGTVTGNVFKGRWDQLPTRYAPNDAGVVELTMSADGRALTGRWNRDGSPTSWHTDWNGTCRVGACDRNTAGSAPPPTGTPTGTVLVNGAPYTSGAIPYGSTVDVTNGTLVLKADVGTLTVRGEDGLPAAFKLVRSKDGKKPVVELRLAKGDFSVCPKRTTSAAAAAPARVVRQVWGDGKGNFRTQGRFASASVRGTKWLTADRCGDETWFKVARGVVEVNDLRKHKRVAVRAGSEYLAKP